MKRGRTGALVAGAGATLTGLLLLALGAAGGADPPNQHAPAPSAALEKIGAGNERATNLAAARSHATAQENLQVADAEFARGQARTN